MPRWPSTLRARLTLWYTVLLALPLVGFAVACYLVFSGSLTRRTDRFIGDALTAFSRELVAERRTALRAVDAMRSTVAEVRFRDLHIAILDSAGRVVATRDSANHLDALAAGRNFGSPLALTVPTPLGKFRLVSQPMSLDGERFLLAGAYSMADIEELLQRIRRLFLIAVPILILCASTGGYLLAQRSLTPLASMTTRAAAISASNLDERLPVGGGDELVGLARVFNDLLDRLERSFAQQRRFVADASHELRTPTAILGAEADVTLAREHRTEAEYRASATVMQNAAKRLGRVVDELFLLARADAGHLVAHPEALYLEDLVHDTARVVQPVADRREVQIVLGQLVEAPFHGDPDLLGRVLLNLLDNAIKYSPEGGRVDVEMRRRNGSCEICVVDQGPGIPPEMRERVFERFFRVDTARSRNDTGATSGAGLGLAIARWIAEMHHGRLDLADSRPGRTEFRLTLPV